MDAAGQLLVLLLVGLVAAVAVLGALLVRARRPGSRDGAHDERGQPGGAMLAVAVEQAVGVLAAERDAALRQTVDTVVQLARAELGHQTELAARDLAVERSVMADRLDGVQGELQRVSDLLGGLRRERAAQQGELLAGLESATRASHELAGTTASLREALSSSRARGQWGERMADDVLRLAGFVEGVNYRRQTAVASGGVPDVTFLLPHGRELHMDVKFPLDNYLRVLEAGSDQEALTHRRQFLRDVRARLRELTGRGYTDGPASLDYLLLFIPNESVYAFVHEHDRDLLDEALRQRVVLCSPSTLFAVLAVVRQAVDAHGVERTADQILQVLGTFTDEWERFSASVDKVGRAVDAAQRAVDDMAGPRRRQLQKRIDRVEELRAERGGPASPEGGETPFLQAVASP